MTWQPLVDPMTVPSSDPDNTVHVIVWIVCCRVWPTDILYASRTRHCVLCGRKPQILMTDGNQVRLSRGLNEEEE